MSRSFLRSLPERLAILLMAVIFGILLLQIVARFFDVSFNWAQEFTVFAFVWLIFFGIAAAYCRSEHMVVDFLYNMIEPRLGKGTRLVWFLAIEAIQMAVMIVLAVGLVIMTYQSWPLRAGAMPDFRIGYLYLGAFIAIAISIVAQISNIAEALNATKENSQ